MSALSHDIFFKYFRKRLSITPQIKESLGLLKSLSLSALRKKTFSKASGVPSGSVRYDRRMPKILKDRLREWANLFNLVAQFFDGDPEKTALWFKTTNPMLGNISPRDMLRFGRYQKLLKFIINAISENKS